MRRRGEDTGPYLLQGRGLASTRGARTHAGTHLPEFFCADFEHGGHQKLKVFATGAVIGEVDPDCEVAVDSRGRRSGYSPDLQSRNNSLV